MRNEFVRCHKYFLVIFTLNLFWKTTVQSCAKEKKKGKRERSLFFGDYVVFPCSGEKAFINSILIIISVLWHSKTCLMPLMIVLCVPLCQ